MNYLVFKIKLELFSHELNIKLYNDLDHCEVVWGGVGWAGGEASRFFYIGPGGPEAVYIYI